MKQTRLMMGMPITIEVVDNAAGAAVAPAASEAKEAIDDCFLFLQWVDDTFSTYKEDSEISRINQQRLTLAEASQPMRAIFALSEQTGGVAATVGVPTPNNAPSDTPAATDTTQSTDATQPATQPATSAPTQAPTAVPPTAAPPTPTTAVASGLKDGQFTGPEVDAFYGIVQVQVTIQKGKITNVQFLQYPNDRSRSVFINDQAMPMLQSEAIQAQSAQVDVIGGATLTSQAFVESMQAALDNAKA